MSVLIIVESLLCAILSLLAQWGIMQRAPLIHLLERA